MCPSPFEGKAFLAPLPSPYGAFMAGRKKSWQEKLEDDKDLPKIVTVEEGGEVRSSMGA